MHRRRILFNIKSAQSDLKLWESSMLKIRILSTGVLKNSCAALAQASTLESRESTSTSFPLLEVEP